MNLRLISALNRRRLRRRLKIESAILENMEETQQALKKGIPEQKQRVLMAEAALDGSLSAADIARRLDREAKAGLLA